MALPLIAKLVPPDFYIEVQDENTTKFYLKMRPENYVNVVYAKDWISWATVSERKAKPRERAESRLKTAMR